MRKIDCTHSRSVKMLPWPWFREIDVCIKGGVKYGRVENFFNKWPFRGNFMRGIDCEQRKILKIFSGGQKMEKIASKLGVISFNPNTPGKFFQNFSMRAIDFSHKITSNESFWKKNFRQKWPNGGFFGAPCTCIYLII